MRKRFIFILFRSGREKEFLDAQEAFDGKGEIDFTVVDGTDEDDAQLTAINEMYSDEAVRTSFDNPLSSLITSDPRFANPTERVDKFGYDPLGIEDTRRVFRKQAHVC